MKKILFVLSLIIGGWFYSDGNNKHVTIGVVTDVQYCDCSPSGSRHYRQSLKKLDECIKYYNSQKLDFIVHLGDIIDHNFSSYDSVLRRFKNPMAPVFHVLGNHDYSVSKKEAFQVAAKLNLKNTYYSKVYGDWQFIFLNGDEMSFFYPGSKELHKETMKKVFELVGKAKCNVAPWNGGLSSKQIEWFKQQLASAERSNKKVVVMCHFPVLPSACLNLWNDEEVVNLLSQHKSVKAYFCGHNHKGDYVLKDGIHFITFKGMVETADTTAFSKVTLTQDSIFVEGHGKEISRRLKVY